jgi:hypothetical protein
MFYTLMLMVNNLAQLQQVLFQLWYCWACMLCSPEMVVELEVVPDLEEELIQCKWENQRSTSTLSQTQT